MLSHDDVQGLARYARIGLGSEEIEPMTDYLNAVIETLEPVLHFDLDDVAPTFHPTADLANVMREDKVGESLPLEVAIQNAPRVEDRCFVVPPILGE